MSCAPTLLPRRCKVVCKECYSFGTVASVIGVAHLKQENLANSIATLGYVPSQYTDLDTHEYKVRYVGTYTACLVKALVLAEASASICQLHEARSSGKTKEVAHANVKLRLCAASQSFAAIGQNPSSASKDMSAASKSRFTRGHNVICIHSFMPLCICNVYVYNTYVSLQPYGYICNVCIYIYTPDFRRMVFNWDLQG